MPHRQGRRQRRSTRLPGYDYSSPGAYFVTICVREGECLLGEVVGAEMRFNEFGRIAHEFWADVPVHFPNVSVDSFVIMPNHLHSIVVIREEGGETPPLQDRDRRGAETAPSAASASPQSRIKRPTLGQIVGYYKHETTRQINQVRESAGVVFWQRNYWEHVIRSEESLNRIREYVQTNPERWLEDQLHPAAAPNRFNQWR